MKVKLNHNVQKLVAIAAKDESRPVLTHVHIENGEAAAADGFIMAVTKVEAEITLDSPGKPMNIPVTLINLLKGFTRSHHGKNIPPKDIIVEEVGENIIGKVENSGALSYTAKADNSNYPALSQIWPHTPYKGILSLNADKLRRICLLSSPPGIITFRIRETTDPVEFVTGDFHGLIMSMFTRESQGVEPSPLWSEIKGAH